MTRRVSAGHRPYDHGMEIDDSDVFDLASSLAELIGAPVTIEDPDAIVIAYSGGSQEVDDARIRTILGRRVPEDYVAAIEAAGVFERIRTSDEVFVVELPEVSLSPRAIVAVRSGGELLGSIWAATGRAPTTTQTQVLLDAAPVVARQLLRLREQADDGRSRLARTVEALLSGTDRAADAAAAAGLTGDLVVAAVRTVDGSRPESARSPLVLHLAAITPRAACGPVGDTLYVVLEVEHARTVLADFLARFRLASGLCIGLGSPVQHAASLPASREGADQVADTLARHRRGGVVATMPEVFTDALIDRLGGFLTTYAAASPLVALRAYDRDHDTELTATAAAFLEAGGNVAKAAEMLHIHPNTARNRIRRARTACGVDLDEPDTRLALMVHLRAAPR